MSLRRKALKLFNRQETKEELYAWLNFIHYESVRDIDWEDEFPGWHPIFNEPYYGNVNNMNEYQYMKLTNFLCLLNVNAANDKADERGW